MKILIVKTSAIGDVTHTLPALHALHLRYPQAEIHWLVEEAAADMVIDHPLLRRVLVSRRKHWLRQFRQGKWLTAVKEISRFIKELRHTRYDLILDFQNLLKSGVLIGLARGKRKVGFGRGMEHSECSYLFLNERIPAVNMDQHAILRELQLLKAVGVDCQEIILDLPVQEKSMAAIKAKLAEKKITTKRLLVAINPLATWKSKLWINEWFAQVADALIGDDINVVFTGGPDDREKIEAILSKMKHKAINLAGETTLKTLIALYRMADLVISTDTGPMHIAAAVSTPVICLFGPTAPWRTGPFGDQHVILRADMPCSPCLKRQCNSNGACMKRISADTVLQAVSAKLNVPFPKVGEKSRSTTDPIGQKES